MKYRYSDTSLPLIIVIGGGFAGIEFVKKMKNKPYRVLLLDKHNYFTFQPLLYQVASSGLSADSIAYPFRRKIGPCPNIIFRMAEVTGIDTANNLVHTNTGDMRYDYLVIAAGATTNFFGNKNLENFSMPLKTIPEALNLRSNILQEFEKAVTSQSQEARKKSMNFIIVGGGPTGVELAGALAEIKTNVIPHDYRELNNELMDVQLIEGGDRLLGGMQEKSSANAKKYLEKLGVKVWLNTKVEDYDGKHLKLDGGKEILTDNVIWTAGVKGITLPGLQANAVTKGNRFLTDAFHKITGYDNIFAIGDIALMTSDIAYSNGHPGVAQVAIQQAKNLAHNFLAKYNNKPHKPFTYKNKGNMATIGRHKAVVDLPYITFGGYLAWYAWMFIHLITLVGFRNKFMVFMNWMWNYFTYDRALRLIIRPFERKINTT
jgi:NADH dehydrogenase